MTQTKKRRKPKAQRRRVQKPRQRPVAVEIDGDDAAWLRGQTLPEGTALVEIDEVEFWGRSYEMESGSSLYMPTTEKPTERVIQRYLDAAEPEPQLIGVDLFAGCGGFSLGMHWGGFDVVAAVEWDVLAAHTYLVNLGLPDCALHFVEDADLEKWARYARNATAKSEEPFPGFGSTRHHSKLQGGCRAFFLGDIRKLTGQQIMEASGVDQVDVVFGGPPCQGLSTANAKACLEDPRNGLLWEFLRIVAEIQPATFIIENVPALLTVAKGALFNALAQLANDAGYDVVAGKLNAAGYGVPQHRVRALVVGQQQGMPQFQFPLPSHWCLGRPAKGKGWSMRIPGESRDDEDRIAAKLMPTASFDPATRAWSVGAQSEQVHQGRRKQQAPAPPLQSNLFAEGVA